MSQSDTNLIWIDLEMTGLDTKTDTIIEIATVVTDAHLNQVREGPALAIYTPDEQLLQQMDEWNTKQHNESGLIKRVRESEYTISEAEQMTLDFLRQWVPPNCSPMCGNTICQDRRFLARQMPELEAYFHYRHIDVTTIKELYKRWVEQPVNFNSKSSSHLALSDVYNSIAELRHYREHFLNVKNAPSEKTI